MLSVTCRRGRYRWTGRASELVITAVVAIVVVVVGEDDEDDDEMAARSAGGRRTIDRCGVFLELIVTGRVCSS